MRIAFASLSAFKAKASLLASLLNLKHRQSLECLAKIAGFSDYHEVSRSDVTSGGIPLITDVSAQLRLALPHLEDKECIRVAEALALHAGPAASNPLAGAPVCKHKNWRFLLRAFTEAHRPMASIPSEALELCLMPAASLAFNLARAVPHALLDRESMTILCPGVSPIECRDDGRWMNFVPWMIGRPNMKIRIILVGNELAMSDRTHTSSANIPLERLSRGWASPYAHLVADRPTCEIFNGTVGQWSRNHSDVTLDACVMFAPGFSMHSKSWLIESELLPIIRQDIPIGVFCYSTALLHKSIERVVPQTPDGFTAWSPLRSWACPSA